MKPIPQFVTDLYEVAIFPQDLFFSNSKTIYDNLISLPLFDGVNQQIPVPDVAPRDIPRIILQSKNNDFRCEISFTKIGIKWLNKKGSKSYSIDIDEILTTTSSILNIVIPDRKILRVGMITQYYFIVDIPSLEITNLLLPKYLIKEGLKDFSMNLTLSRKYLTHPNVNQLIIIQNGETNIDPKNKVIAITNDINTHQDDKLTWSFTKADKFIREAYSHSAIDQIYSVIVK